MLNKTVYTQTHFWILGGILAPGPIYYSTGKSAGKQTDNVALDGMCYIILQLCKMSSGGL